jgi:adenosylcobinamide-GDP ribazoletransferase
MNLLAWFGRLEADFLSAVQFLTRIPVPSQTHSPESLARSVKFFPLIGLLIGTGAALLHLLVAPHLQRPLAALLVLTYLLLITGCLHEDGLADAADGFGGGWTREQILVIFRDSRIGSFGSAALTVSLLARLLLIASIPLGHIFEYLIAAHVLSRWTILPLSYYLPPARIPSEDGINGQGARIAQLTTRGTFIGGTVFSLAFVVALLRLRSVAVIGSAIATAFLSSMYYKKKIGGITGDCFGATNQITEIAIYLCGAWAL